MLKNIRRSGFLYSAGLAINRVVASWLFRFRIFRVYQIDPKTALPKPSNAESPQSNAVEVSLAQTDADILAVGELTWFEPGNMDADFQSAQARVDGQLAGAVWAAGRGFDETDLGLRIVLTPSQNWIFAAMVDKSFRRIGVYSRLLVFMVNHLEQVVGGQQFLSINPTNIASVKAHEKHVGSVLGNVVALRVFGVAFCWCWGKRLERSSWITTNCKSNPISIHLS